jgi:formylglycine-generating enzyme required for sulfatase activity
MGISMAGDDTEKRDAPGIGNSAYEHTLPLRNPRNDEAGVGDKTEIVARPYRKEAKFSLMMVAGVVVAVFFIALTAYLLWPCDTVPPKLPHGSGKVAVMVRTESGRDEKKWFTPGAGKTENFQDCINRACTVKGPEMVVVPKGRFSMGDNNGPTDETPVHCVTIGKPFAVGKFEVTWDEWNACVADGGCDSRPVEKAGGDNGWGRGDRPVIYVSWYDAQSYVKWLKKKTGKLYRLLTEAEWEYVARAGSTDDSLWVYMNERNKANCGGCGSKWDDKKTAPVGSFDPNAFGVHDMHGNVWEWVEDRWHRNYANAPKDGSAWTTGDVRARVIRGGSWNNLPIRLRPSNRGGTFPSYRYDYLGFRVSRTIPH